MILQDMENKNDSQELSLIPDKNNFIKTAKNTWENEKYIVQLSPKEKRVGVAKGLDLEKLLIVKRCLLKSMSGSEIYDKYKIARTTVDKYKKVIKEAKETTRKLQGKDSKRGVIDNSVVPFVLIINNISYETTLYLLICGFGLIGAVFFAHWFYLRGVKYRKKRRAEIQPIEKDFYKAMNLKYLQGAIITYNNKEHATYKSLLKSYGNRNRKIHLVERMSGENTSNQFSRGDKLKDQYAANHWQKLQQGIGEYHSAMDELAEWAKLDYFYSNDKLYRETSKKWLLDFIEPIRDRRIIDKETLKP